MELGPNQKAWVAALRSGKYKQTKHYLSKDGGFCCLGVLCEIAGVRKVAGDSAVLYDNELSMAPTSARKFVALLDSAGEFYTEVADFVDNTTLAGLNDNGADFNMIADVIEARADELFETAI